MTEGHMDNILEEEKAVAWRQFRQSWDYIAATSDAGQPNTLEAWMHGWDAALNLVAAAIQSQAGDKVIEAMGLNRH